MNILVGQIKVREIETRLLNLRHNHNNNSNSNDVGGRPTGRLDLPQLPQPHPPPSPRAPNPFNHNDPFYPFFGATAPPYLPSPLRNEPSVPSYPREVPLLPDYNTLFTKRIAIANTDPNLRAGYSRRPAISKIPHVREAEPSASELPLEDQIRLSPRLRRTFPELSQEEEEPETPKPELYYTKF